MEAESFRILHIHSADDTEYVENFTRSGTQVSFSVSKLSEFAFIIKDAGFPGWAIALIVIDSFLLALVIAYVLLFFVFNKWTIVNGAAVRVIKCGKSGEKTVLITMLLVVVYKNENEIFNKKEEVLAKLK